jgi:REP element-mobilizing transposase RayT
MARTYTELFYHFVWATKGREPLLTTELEPHVHRFLRHKCEEMGIAVYAVNGMPDHVHLACTLPTDLSIADALEKLKGSSSHFANALPDSYLYWQPGYGALTFARRDLTRIVRYIDGQKEHHAAGTLSPAMERNVE